MAVDDKIRIQWYPGHMTKAKREMQEKLKMVDLIIELRDARIPSASKNPMIDELCGNKPRLIILSKKDKANKKKTMVWMQALSNDTTSVLALDILKDNITPIVVHAVKVLMEEKIAKMIRRGIRPRAMRAMVVGVPNVGKSTFINRISKKRVAITGDRPGVTKALQWSKINQDLELLDTPGVLWPRFEDEKVGVLLAISGAIRDEILPLDEIAVWAMKYLISQEPDVVKQRYEVALDNDPYVMFDRLAKKRGFLKNKDEIDFKRTIETFLREIRDDRLGAITWEMPDEDSK